MNNLENVVCNYCGSSDSFTVYVKEGFNIVKCKKCKLVYVNPRLASKEIDNLYDEDYFKGGGFDKNVEYVKEFVGKRDIPDLSDWDVSTLKEMANCKEKGKILDIGSGMGLFLYKSKINGLDAKGLEISPAAVKFAKLQKLDVENNTVYNASLPSDFYDIISMKEVIEHLPDPKRALSIIYKSLKPKGVLFITTGNYNCPERKIKGANWFYFMPKGHIYVFEPSTIKKYLKEAGFSKIIITNQGDLLMNFLLKIGVIETERFIPSGIVKKTIFYLTRFINHFISSGMRIYAIK